VGLYALGNYFYSTLPVEQNIGDQWQMWNTSFDNAGALDFETRRESGNLCGGFHQPGAIDFV
jgi:hypothetical protein